MAAKTQKEKIRDYLVNGGTLTPLDALEKFGCFRLATRVFELKKEGLDIKTEMVENEATGKRYAKYFIPKGGAPLPEFKPAPLPACQPVDDELF